MITVTDALTLMISFTSLIVAVIAVSKDKKVLRIKWWKR
ncbi:putative holin-like toxin [Parageobacillus galactosidasius]|nr:putative holin-like toxin [Parageobacillus galactosidasius]